MARPLENRIALVTGASRGIGRAACMALAGAGAHVIALARTQGALEDLDDAIKAIGGQATLVPCDVKDGPGLDRLGGAIFERWGKLDILIANAGILGPITPLHHLEPRQWDDIMAVNVTANWRLVRSFDPLLRVSDAGRAIFVTSGVAHRADTRPYWGGYAISKAAVDMLARTYAAETVNTSSIKVMAVNPGPLRTKMRAVAMPGEDPDMLKTPEDLAPELVRLCRPDWTQTGALYDFPTNRVLRWQAPA